MSMRKTVLKENTCKIEVALKKLVDDKKETLAQEVLKILCLRLLPNWQCSFTKMLSYVGSPKQKGKTTGEEAAQRNRNSHCHSEKYFENHKKILLCHKLRFNKGIGIRYLKVFKLKKNCDLDMTLVTFFLNSNNCTPYKRHKRIRNLC